MRRFPAIAFPLVAAGALCAGTARAQSSDSFTERAVVSCLSGATVSGLTSGLVLMPLANSGVGTPVVVSAVAVSAGVGCGFGLAFTTAATAYSWAWRSMTAPVTTQQPANTPAESDKDGVSGAVKGMIHAAW